MANFGEMSGLKQWAVVVGGAVLVTAGLYYTVFKSERDQNAAAQQQLEAKQKENRELEAYRPKLAEIERQVASLKQQLDIERRIVPDEKEVDGFMRMMDAEASKAGIELRRYTAKPVAQKEFYTEVPFDVELDGPYYSMLNFFDRVGKLERIVNMSGLDPQAGRCQNEEDLSVRAQRERGGDLHGNHVLQPRFGSCRVGKAWRGSGEKVGHL